MEVMPGQLIRYNFTGIANNSTTALESFYWRDTLRCQSGAAREDLYRHVEYPRQL